MRRPPLTVLALALGLVVFLIYTASSAGSLTGKSFSLGDIGDIPKDGNTPMASAVDANGKNTGVTMGQPIMGKLNNETVKQELGRAAWKVFHTILAQYPEKPDQEAKDTLRSYIHLFSRVYPCRQCAEHFQMLLAQFPPQVSSRESASQWGCRIHNEVNISLNKEVYDCGTISDKYMCGCDEEGETEHQEQEEGITMENTAIVIDETQDQVSG